jgi:hypothetical protein
VSDFDARQPYQVLLFGEKSSLKDVLAPIAERYGASLALPTGETSNTMVADIARYAAADGRPMVIFYFSDATPPAIRCRSALLAGWSILCLLQEKESSDQSSSLPDFILSRPSSKSVIQFTRTDKRIREAPGAHRL